MKVSILLNNIRIIEFRLPEKMFTGAIPEVDYSSNN